MTHSIASVSPKIGANDAVVAIQILGFGFESGSLVPVPSFTRSLAQMRGCNFTVYTGFHEDFCLAHPLFNKTGSVPAAISGYGDIINNGCGPSKYYWGCNQRL